MITEYDDVFRHMNRASFLHRFNVHVLLAPYGIYPGQMPLLLFIDRQPGCTQRDIAKALGVSTPSIATSIKRLQRAGLLNKLPDDHDMRCNNITLTGKGAEMVQVGRQVFDQVTRQMFRGLSPQEMQILGRLTARIEENLACEELRGKSIMSIMEATKELETKSPKGGLEP